MGFEILKASLKEGFVFSSDIILGILSFFFGIILLSALWSSLGFNNSLEYYLVISLVYLLSTNRLFRMIDEDIRTGKISKVFVLPLEMDKFYLYNLLGKQAILLLPLFIILLILSLYSGKFLGVMYLLINLPFLFLLEFYFFLFVSSISVKTESSWGFYWAIRNSLLFFLGGQFIPMPYLKELIRYWVYVLPFGYMGGNLYEVYSGNLFLIIFQMPWIIIFYILSRIIWGKLLREYQAYGL